MRTCDHENCGWRSIAPSAAAAREAYARHLVRAHAEPVDAEIPPGMVEIRTTEDEPWERVDLEEAKRRHRTHHEKTDGA